MTPSTADLSLEDWLHHIQTVHPTLIDYSTERIHAVAQHLGFHTGLPRSVTISGTNGKGSTVHAIESILLTLGYRVGSFTSPYLLKFNEQIRLNGKPIEERWLVRAFSKIEVARQAISLSEFEFTTLAAVLIFKEAKVDFMLLEVGLGGGNDAVSIIASEITIITSIALDHQEYLGETLAAIAANEAKLLPKDGIGIIGLANPPSSITEHAQKQNVRLLCLARDFFYETFLKAWCFRAPGLVYENLPYPKVLCQNAALAIATVLALGIIPSPQALETALLRLEIKGRQQFFKGPPSLLLDVAHNPEAAAALADHLQKNFLMPVQAVFSMFKDKAIAEVIGLMQSRVNTWWIAPIAHARGASVAQLCHAFKTAGVSSEKIQVMDTLETAYQKAMASVKNAGLVVGFGSFKVVKAGLEFLGD